MSRKSAPKQTTGIKTSKAEGGDYAVAIDTEDDHPVSTVRVDGTDTDYQIEHGKAPMEPGPEKPVDPADAAAAKLNRGRGKGG